MSFWKKVQRFFGVPSRYEAEVQRTMIRLARGGRKFTALQAARRALKNVPGADADAIRAAANTADDLFERGILLDHGYTKSLVEGEAGEAFVFHPTDDPPHRLGRKKKKRPKSGSKDEDSPKKKKRKRRKKKKPVDPWDTGSLMRLSPKEMRSRALTIDPLRTPWIFRTDVIPPADDERTALIDRGLELRGLLTRGELDTIHQVGDLWLKHRRADLLARAKATGSAEAAVRQLRAERAERKRLKQAAAAKRKRERAAAIAERRATDIVFAGRGVSSQLHDRRSRIEVLEALGLPLLSTPGDLAKAIGIDVPTLRWLCFHHDAPTRIHYVQFEIPKRRGGTRLLSAPLPKLAAAQRWVLQEVLKGLEVHEAAHGFVPGRSTVTGARPHQGQRVVVNLDLKDFFPTVTFPRVRGLFGSMGYSPAVATLLALLCTEAPRQPVEFEGQRCFVALGPRGLPQGSCTSPALSNLVARRLDRRLAGMAKAHGWTYSRYADDLSFSHAEDGDIAMLLARVRHVTEEEGFRLHPDKRRIQRSGGRQEVTGIVVNHPERLGLPRREVRRLRAILHNAAKTGLEAQNRDGHPDFRAFLRGKIAYLAMIDPQRAEPMRCALERLS